MTILCWIVTDGQAGPENQCLGVAQALGVTPVIKRIALRWPWKTLTPFLGGENERTFSPLGDKLQPPWPDLVLASGRKAIAAARYIKRMAGNRTFTVYIQNPHTSPSQFDLVAVPMHDRLIGPNVIVTTAAPTRITADRLEEARDYFADPFGEMPSPRVAVLVIGNSRSYKLTESIMQKFTAQLHKLASERKVSLMIRTSHKTGRLNEEIIDDGLYDDENAWIWDPETENPYLGFLAWADYIIVTADSVSLISEAAATGKPIYMIPLEGHSTRVSEFHKNMMDRGILRIFDGTLEDWIYAPLNDSALIAEEIKKRLKSPVSL
jgi:mitochondrial fission protein ELM1